ncbi:MAG: hypothetical protein ACT4QC_18460 [Planctomycetaceae bacterium]
MHCLSELAGLGSGRIPVLLAGDLQGKDPGPQAAKPRGPDKSHTQPAARLCRARRETRLTTGHTMSDAPAPNDKTSNALDRSARSVPWQTVSLFFLLVVVVSAVATALLWLALAWPAGRGG